MRTGLHTGIRTGVSPSDGVVASAFPESSAQWEVSFPTVVGPAAIHTMQDTSLPIVDRVGESDLLAGTVAPTVGGTGDPLGRRSTVYDTTSYLHAPALPLAAGDFSVWMRLQSAVPADTSYIASVGGLELFAQRLASGVYRVGMNDGINGYVFASATASADSDWHDFLVTRAVGTQTLTLWVDDAKYTGTGLSAAGDLSETTYEIGRSVDCLPMEVSYHTVFGYALSDANWATILAARA